MVVSDKNGRVVAANAAWEAVLGWTDAELRAQPPLDIVHPEDVEAARAELMHVVGAERVRLKFESRLRGKDGVYRRFSWRLVFADDLVYSVGHDVTELRQREEALRHTQKMEAIGQLTGGIAHDFNNLLTIVRSSIDLLKKPGLPEARRARYVSAIDAAVARAAKVTQQLLAFARRQRLEPEVFDVAERIADVSELLSQVVGSNIQIETIAPAEPCRIEADLCQFETALMNLAINARDAMADMAETGRITIEARPVGRLPPIRGHAGAGGQFIAITLRDTGVGIASALQGEIFEPFFTTKGVGKGTGLGLSQVYGFAMQSGGAIEVDSEPGAGAAFTLYLPRSDAAAVMRPPQPARAAPGGPSRVCPGLRALVVEDNEDVGQFCVSMMYDLGYRPVWARNGAEALQLLQQRQDFDLVFIDVVMPGISGIELADRIRRDRPQLPLLLTSGYSAVLAQEGARGFPLLPKPYSAADLEAALARVFTTAH
jgi:PAS domain S-box-containing protein